MSILTKYILKRYLLNFIIVLVSLELFFVGIDFLQNFKKLPDSANLQILYLLYNSFFTLTLALPLSIIFAWIITLVLFIKNNELVAFNAVGSTSKRIYMPIVIVSLSLISLLVALQGTPLAYSYEQKSKIASGDYFISTKSDIFLKYNNNYVYFKKLLPLEKKAEDIHIYETLNGDIVKSIVAKNAYFQKDRWYIVDAKIMNKPKDLSKDDAKLEVRYEKFLHTLEGFKPKILDNVYEARSSFSIYDAVSALILLSNQGINTDKIRGALYNQMIVPYFVMPLILLVFAYASLNSRFFNMGKFTSFSVFGTLIVWGVFFVLYKFTSGGVVIPEVSLLLPMILWIVFALFFYNRKINS